MSRSRRMSFISPHSPSDLCWTSPAPAPSCPSPAHINMHVIGAGVTTGVDAESAHELRVLELDDLHRQTYHTAVDGGEFSVAVRVDGHIGRVTVLVLTVACGASNPAVVLRCPEPGVNVDINVGDGLVAVPACNLLNHELQLVEEFRVHRRIARPLSFLIVIQEVADQQMLCDRQIDVGGSYLQESFRGWSLATRALGEIRPDAIAAQHSPLLLLEGDQHRQRQ